MPRQRQDNLARKTLYVFPIKHLHGACKTWSTHALVTLPRTPNLKRRLILQVAPHRACKDVGNVIAYYVVPLLPPVEYSLRARAGGWRGGGGGGGGGGGVGGFFVGGKGGGGGAESVCNRAAGK